VNKKNRYPSFNDDEAVIIEALNAASVPALMSAMMLIDGDFSRLNGIIKPGQGMLGEVQGFMPIDDQNAIRAEALEVIKSYQKNDFSLPELPNDEMLYQLMCFTAGQELPIDSSKMMLEELALEKTDPREFILDPQLRSSLSEYTVVVIGGGMSGILAAIRLQQNNIPYILLEKNADKGGTWYENSYPGARVDIPAQIYCYSFEPSNNWRQFYPQQKELKSYFDHCVEKYHLQSSIRFNTEATSINWLEHQNRWQITTTNHLDGKQTTLLANSVISAVGQLNRPQIPDIKGADNFNGAQFHSAQFQHQLDFKEKTVAVIGSGASAFQLAPEMAKLAKNMKVFQRSPAWMFPNPGYHDDIDQATRWLLANIPYYDRFYRFLLFWVSADALLPTLIRDDSWPDQDRSINAANDMYREHATQWIESQINDPELLAKVVPSYPPFVKRILQDNGSWLEALQQPHVELITDSIESIDATGIHYRSSSTAQHVDVDVIIYATGFHANKWLYPMAITGRNNQLLSDVWGDDPKAYLGITVPDFPNFYCMYGPNTNLAHAGTLFFNSECQIRYILKCIELQLMAKANTIEIKADVNKEYNQRVQAEFAKTVWVHKGTDSWYKNSQGNITTNTPWRLADYWQWTLAPDAKQFNIQ
tara:strand:- start:285 stop:2222 length:1938 start_codon:yes stop_codon:yes gene_type:complete